MKELTQLDHGCLGQLTLATKNLASKRAIAQHPAQIAGRHGALLHEMSEHIHTLHI